MESAFCIGADVCTFTLWLSLGTATEAIIFPVAKTTEISNFFKAQCKPGMVTA